MTSTRGGAAFGSEGIIVIIGVGLCLIELRYLSGQNGVLFTDVLDVAFGLYAVHRLADGRWEVIAPDADPHRPAWRRVAVVDPPSSRPNSILRTDRRQAVSFVGCAQRRLA